MSLLCVQTRGGTAGACPPPAGRARTSSEQALGPQVHSPGPPSLPAPGPAKRAPGSPGASIWAVPADRRTLAGFQGACHCNSWPGPCWPIRGPSLHAPWARPRKLPEGARGPGGAGEPGGKLPTFHAGQTGDAAYRRRCSRLVSHTGPHSPGGSQSSRGKTLPTRVCGPLCPRARPPGWRTRTLTPAPRFHPAGASLPHSVVTKSVTEPPAEETPMILGFLIRGGRVASELRTCQSCHFSPNQSPFRRLQCHPATRP